MLPPRRLIAFVLLIATVSLASLPQGASAASPRAFASKVNKARASHGLPALRASVSLRGSSRAYARWMLRRDSFGHRARIQASKRFSLRGEVLARTPARAPTAGQIIRAWLDSPSHRAVLLNPRYRYIGVGLARGRLAGRPTTLLVGHFGR